MRRKYQINRTHNLITEIMLTYMSSLKKAASLTYFLLHPEPKSWNWRTTKAGWNKSWERKWPLMVSQRGQCAAAHRDRLCQPCLLQKGCLRLLCSLWAQLSQQNVRSSHLAPGEDIWADLPSPTLLCSGNYTNCALQAALQASWWWAAVESNFFCHLSRRGCLLLCSIAGHHSVLGLLWSAWDYILGLSFHLGFEKEHGEEQCREKSGSIALSTPKYPVVL